MVLICLKLGNSSGFLVTAKTQLNFQTCYYAKIDSLQDVLSFTIKTNVMETTYNVRKLIRILLKCYVYPLSQTPGQTSCGSLTRKLCEEASEKAKVYAIGDKHK